MVLQRQEDGVARLKRVILIGTHADTLKHTNTCLVVTELRRCCGVLEERTTSVCKAPCGMHACMFITCIQCR
jgi:hypothetical protein